ncbi:MAG TPA: 2Fe-2S iron-sulfur cluster-binding protein [Polyangia bacterium]|nr:2Fe-2S iron-sulfur cluster-binding protein [Polyangia bacterium]
MASITYLPDGTRLPCAPGESVFEVARRGGVRVPTACAGQATCGLCRVKVVSGEEHLTSFNAAERKHLGNVYFITKLRLSCQARIRDDADAAEVIVAIPPG